MKEAAVLARDDVAGADLRLVAYVVMSARPATHATLAASVTDATLIRASLGETLPDYMVPSHYVVLDSLPLTPNGKLDRRALPAPERGGNEQTYLEPGTDTERALASIWSEVLHVERVGAGDNFFELGGHSLLASQVRARIGRQLGREISLRSLFDAPVLNQLAAHIDGSQAYGFAPQELTSLPRDGREFPLSYAQERLWLLQQAGLGSAYNMDGALALHGPLSLEALQGALDELIQRHEILRTRFAVSAKTGLPYQAIETQLALPLRVRDARADEVAHLLRAHATEGFDLSVGPLLRGLALRLAPEHHVIGLTLHHIVMDGWSMGILVRDLQMLYAARLEQRAAQLAPLQVQYADYAQWQRGKDQSADLSYWLQTLASYQQPVNVLGAPGTRLAPHGEARTLTRIMPAQLAERLMQFSGERQMSAFMVLLAALALLLYRHTRATDLCIGTTVAGRGELATEALIGFFINIVPLRIGVSDEDSGEALLARVRHQVLEGLSHDGLPFEQLLAALPERGGQGGDALLPVMLRHQNFPEADAQTWAGGVRAQPTSVTAVWTARCDLDLQYYGDVNGMEVVAEYDSSRLEEGRVKQLLDTLEVLLGRLVSDASMNVQMLIAQTEAERERLTQWNHTHRKFDTRSVCELFSQQVKIRPHEIACREDGRALTYQELDSHARQIAHALHTRGVGVDETAQPGARIGVLAPRGVDFVTALLGIWMAGGVYVGLEPSYPPAYVRHIVEDAAPTLLLTDDATRLDWLDNECEVLELGTVLRNQDIPQVSAYHAAPRDLAYIAYTSGSTGRPKGVAVPHGQLLNVLASLWQQIPFDAHEVVAQKTPTPFVVSIKEMLAGLLMGLPQVVFSDPVVRDVARFAQELERARITRLNLVPSHLSALLEHASRLSSLRHVITAGEPLTQALRLRVEAALPAARLYNNYGCTELNDITYCMPGDQDSDGAVVPAGRPVGNLRVYVLDAAGREQPQGLAGEIHVEGEAGQYWGRPELDAQRRVANPYGAPGSWLFRTGDIGRRLADGRVDVMGRADLDVKVRGQRIDLRHVESVLAAHEHVRQCVVSGRADATSEVQLVGYYVLYEPVSVQAIRAWLVQRLPGYMVPGYLMALERLPQLPNGKLDRQALPAPGEEASAEEHEAPAGATQQSLAQIWAQVLKLPLERIGRWDSFFELGGHSLLATQLASQIRAVHGVELELRTLFETPVLDALAQNIEDLQREGAHTTLPAIEPVARHGAPLALSFAQQRLWFLDQLEPGSALYNIPAAIRLVGRLDIAALEKTLNEVVRRHEALRTHFVEVDGTPVQVVVAELLPALQRVSIEAPDAPARDKEVGRLLRQEALRAFDLSTGPLIRAGLLHVGEDEHVVYLTVHHIVSDGWSTGVLVQEVAALYGAFVRGEPSPLTPLGVQYADFAHWQRTWLAGDTLDRQLQYWTQQLSGAPSLLTLPLDHSRPAVRGQHGSTVAFTVDEHTTTGLNALARREQGTLFMVLTAAFNVLLARYANQDDICIGTPIANRRHAGLENLIGFFANTLVLRTQVDTRQPFLQLLQQVKETTLSAYAHQDVPFEQLVEVLQPSRSMGHSPLFQVMLALQNAPLDELSLPGLSLRPLQQHDDAPAKFDLTLTVREQGTQLFATLEYDADLFAAETIERMSAHFVHLLDGIVADATARVGELPMLSADERAQRGVPWNDTEIAYAHEQTLHGSFEEQARRTPDNVALVYEDAQLSYGELNARSNRLAHHLRQLGIGPDVRVGLYLGRSLEIVVGLLAVLKAGGACVPLDPSDMQERLSFMLAETTPAVLITHASLPDQLETGDAVIFSFERDGAQLHQAPVTNPHSQTLPQHLAYVTYRPGFAIRPDGVGIDHRTLGSQLAALTRATLGIETGDALLLLDAVSPQSCMLMATGRPLVLASDAASSSPEQLSQLIPRHAIAALHATPSAWQRLLDYGWPLSDRTLKVLCAGDASFGQVAKRLLAHTPAILHLFGPPETGNWCALGEVTREQQIVIGRPVTNTRFYLLDAHLNPVPVGVVGQLYVAGATLARGYLTRAEATAERFVPDPSGAPGDRMYCAAERARALQDGSVELLSRVRPPARLRGAASPRSKSLVDLGTNGVPYVAPVTEAEQALAAIWAEILGIVRVGRNDNFFDLGGHSLMATRVISRVRTQFRIDVPLLALFEASTLMEFAKNVKTETTNWEEVEL
ncbi:amino acid adenylation domain-containing protein [Caballeronia sp. dw_276]|uniref:amino acid adenylation domain-containing protein n=1 Tax=Caballeronia sp. dw_276 TaxID=2719795 RepID=UPI003211C021